MGTSEVTMSYSNNRYCKQDAKSEDWSKNVVNWHPENQVMMCKLSMPKEKQPPEVFCKKYGLKNFAKFTGKHLCQSLFF